MDTPKELFKFDIEAQIRKDMPEFLMETEELAEEEAKEETEKMIKMSKEMTKFCKKELENIKCDFKSGNLEDEINKHLVIKKRR